MTLTLAATTPLVAAQYGSMLATKSILPPAPSPAANGSRKTLTSARTFIDAASTSVTFAGKRFMT